MSRSELKLPYRRPTLLSDPHYDYTPEHLASMLATPDQDLKWHDYQSLLGPFLPAGTYEESAYFLPLAFDYILTNDDHALDLVTSLVWFASEYAAQLEGDGVIKVVRAKLQHCLDHWSSEFAIIHFDRDACRARGYSRDYADYVHHSETLMEAANDFIRFKTHSDLAITFFADLATAESAPVKSAWFLESARACVAKDVRRPPKHPEIRRLLGDYELAAKHSKTVRDLFVGFNPESTYWQDTFALLGTTYDT